MPMFDISPIVVFVVIVAVGLFLMRGSKTQSKPQPKYTAAPNRRDVVKDDRIRTSWGYTFPADYEFKPENVRSREQLLADLKRIVQANFKEYKIYYQVPASALEASAHPACEPITFLFEKDGVQQLALFVVRENNYRGMNVQGSKDICYDRGIPWIQLFEEYANDDDYVVAYLRHYLSQVSR